MKNISEIVSQTLHLKREKFIRISALIAGTVASTGFKSINHTTINSKIIQKNKSQDSPAISTKERMQRIAHAQQLMLQKNIQAIVLEGGTSMEYFTGISWWISERTMVTIIPSNGEIIYVCPAFEKNRLREQISIGKKILTWEEDESPFAQIAVALHEAGISHGQIGMEEEIRFFIYDGIRNAAPDLNYISAEPVVMPCRMIKSAAEIALMQKATDITIAAMKSGIAALKEGILQSEISDVINNAHQKMGATPDFALVLFGDSSSLPHGSLKPAQLKKGDIVLMDCGCKWKGYSSDITRTIVFGDVPTKRQQDIWNLEQKAQAAGFASAKMGSTCEQVDAAARKVILDSGFGPGYKVPGLPHRTGHGIGMDGHEWAYMVKGNKQRIESGMCFSVEPTIIIPGEFGVRLEDCVYMTDEGPKWFSQPAISIDRPFV